MVVARVEKGTVADPGLVPFRILSGTRLSIKTTFTGGHVFFEEINPLVCAHRLRPVSG